MIKKSFYEAPEAELLLVKFEESFLTGTTLTTGKSNVEIPEEEVANLLTVGDVINFLKEHGIE